MYAIIRTGGKQYRVQPGDVLRVEKLEKDLGSSFDISDVLFLGGEKSYFGTPTVAQAKVHVVVTEHDKGAKVLVFKKKRRKGYRRMQGHRQWYTALFVESITSPDGQTAKADGKAHVIDPAKKAARLAAFAESMKAKKAAGEKVVKKAKPATKAAAPKKAVAKKGKAKAKPKKGSKTSQRKAARKTAKKSK